MRRKALDRRSCTRCKETELILDAAEDEDPSELYCLACGFSFRARGRQGRNAKSRVAKPPNPCQKEEFGCLNCNSMVSLIVDHVTGDCVCTSCGFVNDSGGLSFSSSILMMDKNSKNYQRKVHYRQRMAQLRGVDPEIDRSTLDLIQEHVLSRGMNTPRLGKKNFGAICKHLAVPKKTADSWIQIRNELGFEPNTNELADWLTPELLGRMELRFVCVEMAFVSTLSSKHGSEHRLSRTNIINLNYIIPQIMRLESEQLWEYCAKFFKQLSHEKHPGENNARWAEIIGYCDQHFRKAVISKDGGEQFFEWKYIPMRPHEILTRYDYFY